jgi:polar amino acid transport system substrate-binding protein
MDGIGRIPRSLVGESGMSGDALSDQSAIHELVPSETLRVGLVAAPARSMLFVAKDVSTGEPRGITVDLARSLAQQLRVPISLIMMPNSGACTEALEQELIDITFMPVDDERRRKVAFGPAYYIMESTYLVTASSGIMRLSDIDRRDVRIVGITNTTTIRSAVRALKNTTPMAVETIDHAVDLLRAGQADALALSRDAFQTLLPLLPGARVLNGGFQTTEIAIAVGQNKPFALSYVSRFVEEAKMSGLVRKAFDDAGFPMEPVAPGH